MTKEVSIRDMTNLFTEIYGLIAEADGEISEENQTKLEALYNKAATKVDSADFIIEKYSHDAEYFKQMAKRYTSMARQCETVVDRVKDRVIQMMQAANVSEIQGASVRAKISDTKGEIVIDDPSKLPASCVIVKTEPNKVAIRVAIESKKEVPGAHIKINKSLRFSVRK